uniref:PID domain-containing protein n=1 Tax=Pelodiscus sinensis TaxID=13735 RepID=K7F6L9_PELSI
YMGCIEVLRSMRSLDFNTRTQVTREAINRLYEAVPGVKGAWKKKAPNRALFSILGKSNLRFAGMSIAVNISIDGLNLMIPTTRQLHLILPGHPPTVLHSSTPSQDTTDYVAYVAKDPINQRACHILECCEGLAQSVISTVGQAFELRFKQYLHSPPPGETTAAPRAPTGTATLRVRAAAGAQFNPGPDVPAGTGLHGPTRRRWLGGGILGGGISGPSCSATGGVRDVAAAAPMGGQSCDGYLQAGSQPLACRDYEEHMYVNTQCLDGWEADARRPEESPPKDLFDM